jgi:predicted O-methyltransferase YrrM
MTAVQSAHAPQEGPAVSIQDVMIAVSRLQATMDALAAAGARAAVEADGGEMPPEISSAVGDVLTAVGLPDIGALPPPQRAMVAATVRSMFAQAADMLAAPDRAAGWTYTDDAVLEGQGRGSMIIPTLLAQTGEFGDVTELLDVGTGVGWLAVGAVQVWPNSTVVGIDVWQPALERARRNIASAGCADRIEIRDQAVTALDDRDRYDLTWVPAFFLAREILPSAFDRILAATRTGGQIVVARYDPPPDPLPRATLRLRTIRDGGSWIETAELVDLLTAAGWADVHEVPKPGPVPLGFVAGRKA